MDSVKIGKFIAQQRKIKGLTQEEFAEQLNVTRALVSRWERGLTFPIIDLIIPICSVLDLEIHELFECNRKSDKQIDINHEILNKDETGEEKSNLKLKDEKNNTSNEHDITTINIVKTYTKKSKSKYIKIMLSVIFCVIIFFIGLLLSYHYNYYTIKELNVLKDEITVSGMLFSNEIRDILVINDIYYNSSTIGTIDEKYAKEVTVSLLGDDEILYTNSKNSENIIPLSEFLKNTSIYYDLENEQYNKVYLNIKIITSENEMITMDFNLF